MSFAGCGDDSKDETTRPRRTGLCPRRCGRSSPRPRTSSIWRWRRAGRGGREGQAARCGGEGSGERDPEDSCGASRKARALRAVAGGRARVESGVRARTRLFAQYDTPCRRRSRSSTTSTSRRSSSRARTTRPSCASRERSSGATWDSLRADVDDAGAAARFDAHVKAIEGLVDNTDPDRPSAKRSTASTSSTSWKARSRRTSALPRQL